MGIIAIGCGFVYYHQFSIAGLVLASAIVFVGCGVGASVTFLLSRYLFRHYMLRWLSDSTKFKVIEAVVQHNGLRIALVVRLSPIFPFVLTNYVFGVSSIRLAQYEVALLAILPGCVFYSFLGSTISHLSDIASANKSLSAASPAGLTFL